MSQTCTHCGRPVESTETHHVDQQRGNNDPDNLTERCRRCHHGKAHDNQRRTDTLSAERYGPRTPSIGPPG